MLCRTSSFPVVSLSSSPFGSHTCRHAPTSSSPPHCIAASPHPALQGIYGGNLRATNFLCLTLKLLQIQPEKEIIVEFIKNEDNKYVRLLGAFYLRLVGRPLEVYEYLEVREMDPRGTSYPYA